MSSSAARWGALLASSLLSAQPSGCTPATPAPPETPPAPAETAAPPAPPPPTPPPRLTPLVFATELPADPGQGNTNSHGRTNRFTLRYGRGEFTHTTYQRWGGDAPACPVQRAEGCGTFTISTTGKSPDEKAWNEGAPAPADEKRVERDPAPAPHDWVAFAPGRDAVYALRNEGKVIDRIDDQGKVTVFAQDEALARWGSLWVFEVGGRTLLAGAETGFRTAWHLAELLPAEQGAPRKLGPLTRLPMAPLPAFRPNAQGARAAADSNGMALHGSPHAIPLADDGDKKNLWALVWLETVPPPFRWPAGKPHKTPAPKKAKNGCGGPPSRGLEDPSVEKRAHVTRFSGASVVDDTVAWATNDLNPYDFRLQFRVEGGKVTVDPLPKATKKGAPQAPSPGFPRGRRPGDSGELRLFPDETPVAAAFDENEGEGLLVLRDSLGKVVSRRFDAEGNYLGEAAVYPHDAMTPFEALSRVGKRWFALGSGNTPLINLTDGTPPTSVAEGHHQQLDLFTSEGKLFLLTYNERVFWLVPIDEQGRSMGPPVKLADAPEKMEHERFFVQHIKGSPPMLAAVGAAEDSALKLPWIWAKPGATWSTTEVKTDERVYPYGVQFRRIHGDLVATHEHRDKTTFTWVRAGQSRTQDTIPHDPASIERPISNTSGPLFGAKLVRLPAAPGALVAEPDLESVRDECGYRLPTGPTTTVLVCTRAVDPIKPGVRVGLRVLHHEP